MRQIELWELNMLLDKLDTQKCNIALYHISGDDIRVVERKSGGFSIKREPTSRGVRAVLQDWLFDQQPAEFRVASVRGGDIVAYVAMPDLNMSFSGSDLEHAVDLLRKPLP